MRSVNFYYMFTILDRLSAYLKSSKKKKKTETEIDYLWYSDKFQRA